VSAPPPAPDRRSGPSADHHRVQRVLLVHEFGGGVGGAERYLETLAAGLRADDVDVAALVFARQPGGGDELAARLRSADVATTVHDHRARARSVRRQVRAHRPQVLHWTFVDPHAFQGAALLLLPWGVPSVITEHLPMLRAGWHRRVTRDLANRRLAAAIVVGDAGADEVRRAWPHPPRTVVVPNGVPLASEARCRATGPAHDPARLLFVGRLTDQKGVEQLPGIVAALAARGIPARLRVVGAGPERAGLERLAEQEVPGMVQLLGPGDPGDELAQADVLLVPSRWEGGFPLSAREALAAGVPAVVSDIPPHHDLGDGGAAVRVVGPGGAGAWAAAVAEVLADLSAAGQAARRLAAASTVEHMVESTRAVYDEAVDRVR
jgi:glycosyltransferase involved in cell wall biosynthesis